VGLAFFSDPEGYIQQDNSQLVLLSAQGQGLQPVQAPTPGAASSGQGQSPVDTSQGAVQQLLALQSGCQEGGGCLDTVYQMLSGVVAQLQVQ
jgi:hypothetical protein